jgi:hypothetical protein
MVGDHPVVVRAPRADTEKIGIGSKVVLTWPPERSRPLIAPADDASR